MIQLLPFTWVFLLFATVLCDPKFPNDPFKGIESKNSDKPKDDEDFGDLPFEDIATRAPMTVQEREKEIYRKGMEELNKPIERPTHHRRRIHRPGAGGYYRPAIGGAIYNIYPIMYPKGADYCPQMRGIFRFTCQPSKPLRLDLVEFCKEYSSFCGVINTHRLPGPGIGPPPDSRSMGHVGVNVGFGFSIGSVPGLEVSAGYGVDVGPLPIGESIGVDVTGNIGLLGASPPLKYRRGMDKPTDSKSGLVGIGGNVGVKTPGSEGVGVGTGLGVGR